MSIRSVQFIDGNTQVDVWNEVVQVPAAGEHVLLAGRWRRVVRVEWESYERAYCYLQIRG